MPEILNHLIYQLNNSVFVLIAILLLSFWTIHIITKLMVKFSHHEDKLSKFDGLSEKLMEISTKVDLIYRNTNPHAHVHSYNPITITESGEEISMKINANPIFSKYASQLIALVEEVSPKNAYDIQIASMNVTKDKFIPLLDENELNTIKDIAFSKGLIVEDIMGIFGVMLREKLLEQKRIPVA
jgi:hypothetical protein